MPLVLVAVIAQTASLVLSRVAATTADGFDRYLSAWYVLSLLALGVQALVWQQALRRLPLTIAYPMMSLVFVLIPIVARFLFDETISVYQIAGSAIIVIGTVQIGLSRTE